MRSGFCCESCSQRPWIAAGLIDEIGFSIHPVLLGGGVPALVPFANRVELELIEARPIARECVMVRYRTTS